MKTFLRDIKSDSYFGLLMKKPEMNPHSAVFMSNVLDEFETRFLKNDRARE